MTENIQLLITLRTFLIASKIQGLSASLMTEYHDECFQTKQPTFLEPDQLYFSSLSTLVALRT